MKNTLRLRGIFFLNIHESRWLAGGRVRLEPKQNRTSVNLRMLCTPITTRRHPLGEGEPRGLTTQCCTPYTPAPSSTIQKLQ